MGVTISVSQYHDRQEQHTCTFTLPEQGDECREYLAAKLVNRHRRRLSDQFGFLGGDLDAAFAVGAAIHEGRYEDAARIAAANPYRY